MTFLKTQIIKNNTEFLEGIDNAFFSVNVVARKPEKNTPDTNPYIKKFLALSKWSPKKIAVFAGKVNYPQYRFIDKFMIRLIMWITKGPTDTSKTYEFTDWDKVEEFAYEIKKIGASSFYFLSSRLSRSPRRRFLRDDKICSYVLSRNSTNGIR